MKIETLSVFPHCYDSVMNESMMRIAQEKDTLISLLMICEIGLTTSTALPMMNHTVVARVL